MENELIELYEEYIALIADELNDLIALAHVHGWQSPKVEKGEELRAKIKELKEKKDGDKK